MTRPTSLVVGFDFCFILFGFWLLVCFLDFQIWVFLYVFLDVLELTSETRLALTSRELPAPVFRVLGLKVFITTTRFSPLKHASGTIPEAS